MCLIIFCGPLGDRVGGGESGNRKTISLLEGMGLEVRRVGKPYPKDVGLLRPILYIFQLLFYIVRFVFSLIASPKESFVHISGFYGHLIYLEFILVLISMAFRVPCVYELRAGGAITFYKNGSFFYKFFFKYTVVMSDYVLCQGKEYQSFIFECFSKEAMYYPNFIEKVKFDSLLSGDSRSSDDSIIKLVYFGRVVPSKNVKSVIKVAGSLKKSGYNVILDIIGSCDSNYKIELDEMCRDLELVGDVNFLGVLYGESLLLRLMNYHFFIFPTTEKREGHSNSLTEAMACGVVPIVTDYGFNKSVLSNDSLVIGTLDSDEFYKKIIDVWKGGQWLHLSKKVRERVENNYLDSVVKEDLMAIYKICK